MSYTSEKTDGQIISESVKYFTRNHPKFNLTQQGAIARSHPHLLERIKASAERETQAIAKHIENLRQEEAIAVAKLASIRAKLAELKQPQIPSPSPAVAPQKKKEVPLHRR
jgi:hypothetical protein